MKQRVATHMVGVKKQNLTKFFFQSANKLHLAKTKLENVTFFCLGECFGSQVGRLVNQLH